MHRVTDGGFLRATSSPFAALLRVIMGLFFAASPAIEGLSLTFASVGALHYFRLSPRPLSPQASRVMFGISLHLFAAMVLPTFLGVSLLALNLKTRQCSFGRLRICFFRFLCSLILLRNSTVRTCIYKHN